MELIQTCIDTISDWTGIKAISGLLELDPGPNDVMLDVPSYSQTDSYSCGSIAAWAIVETFHPRANFARFYDLVGSDPDEGVGPNGVVAALRKFKVGTHYRRNIGWKEIKQAIDDGFPMLIGTGKEDPKLKGDHWSLLYGYGQRPRKVYIGNCVGLLCNQTQVDWDDFLKYWWNPRGQAIVCWGE